MNDNLQPLPDEHIEARITAYVLGEASPFEAAELEDLIARSPELKLFLNRTRALHILITEAETTSNRPHRDWKLPVAKRDSLEHILGPTPDADDGKERRIRRVAFHAAIGIAAVLLLTVFSAPMVIRQRKKADRMVPAMYEELAADRSVPEVTNGIVVSGQVRQPGSVGYRENMTLREAVNRAGGATEFGSAKRVKVLRDGKQLTFDLTKNEFADEILKSGDVIEMPQKNWFGCGASRDDVTNDRLAQVESKPKAPSAAPVDSPKEMEALASNGLRSRDAAITRNSIDAILNNPDRSSGRKRDMPEADTLSVSGIAGAELAESDSGVDAFAPAPAMEPTNLPRRGLAAAQPEGGADLDETVRTNSDLTFNFSAQSDSARARSMPQDVASSKNKKKEHDAVDAFADQSGIADANAPVDFEGFTEYGSSIEPAAESESRFKFSLGGARQRGSNIEGPPERELEKQGEKSLNEESVDAFSDGRGIAEPNALGDIGGFADLGAPVADADPFMDTSGTVSKEKGGKGNTEYEIHTGYASEYLFRGVDLGKDKESLPASELVPGQKSDLAAVEEKLRKLKERIEDSSINDSNKQTLFKEWKQLQEKSIAKYNRPSAPIDLADLSQEIPANQEPFSTFSLNISDASFQIARAAIEKGEQPDPDSIKPEQFYNAVDYGDPAPSSLEPVSAAIDQTAHPVIPGRNLVRVALRTASTGRSAAQPLRLTLLVDQSGSMVRADRRAAMETALEQLATLLTENDEVTVIGFSRTPRLLADSMKGNEAGKLPALINQTANEGGTNLEQAINLASELALRHKLDGAQNRIVLFTDGAANLGNANPERLSDKIETLRQQGLAFDIAGIGTNDTNDNLLSELARHGNGRYYLVGENTGASLAAQLAGAFRPAAENVKVQVKLNPQRVGNYKLIGFEKDRLKTEDFRNDSVDAAELAADEAGVAMYQVETLPEGSGEIGEVSVRFRDTASGEMVERTWTIPYDATTPAFDKADPKTQLATLSLLAAQKLQPGALADAISFRNFSETIARLKQTYANDAKAQQMLNFVNALK